MKSKNVIHILLLVLLFATISLAQTATSFKETQQKHTRVKNAYNQKWDALKEDIEALNIQSNNFDVYLRAFKNEKKLEVWLKNKNELKYKLFKTYDICASSGNLGPKRSEGDGQVPEGFYTIDLFNPTSNYYLSMRVSYPNNSDKILKNGKNAGGAIMVHGNCVTIGCIPITDDKIKELYLICTEAKNRNREIGIDIFPTKLSSKNLKNISESYPKHAAFWNSLKPFYDYFEKTNELKKVNIDNKGKYVFN